MKEVPSKYDNQGQSPIIFLLAFVFAGAADGAGKRGAVRVGIPALQQPAPVDGPPGFRRQDATEPGDADLTAWIPERGGGDGHGFSPCSYGEDDRPNPARCQAEPQPNGDSTTDHADGAERTHASHKASRKRRLIGG
jgi:hypothetical protein